MVGLISAMWLAASSAHAEDADIDPRRLQDITAFTVPEGTWRVGIFDLDYGLNERTSVGIQPAFWLIGPNIKAKSTVLEGERLALSVGAARQRVSSVLIGALLGNPDTSATMSLTPLDTRLSWTIRPKWSLHVGYTRTLAQISGTLTGEQIDAMLAPLIGDGSGISGALGAGEVYADASGRLTLGQSNLAIEWRRSEKSSWIFESNTYLRAAGQVIGTANAGNDTASAGAGAAAVFSVQPSAFLGSATSIAWQRHWDRFNLRVGLPLNVYNPFSYTQALQFYWLL